MDISKNTKTDLGVHDESEESNDSDYDEDEAMEAVQQLHRRMSGVKQKDPTVKKSMSNFDSSVRSSIRRQARCTHHSKLDF